MGLKEIQNIKMQAGEPKVKKVYTIPKVSEKKKKQEVEQKLMAAMDKAFYLGIWQASGHYCQNCGCGLPKTPSNFMFHHLLEKKNYPKFRHEPSNVAILCLECHSKCETNLSFVPKMVARRAEVMKILIG